MKIKYGDKVICFINDAPIGCVDTVEKKKGKQWLRHRDISVKTWLKNYGTLEKQK